MSRGKGHTSLQSSFNRSILWETEAENELGEQGFIEGNIYERKGEGAGLGRGRYQGMQTPIAIPSMELQIYLLI